MELWDVYDRDRNMTGRFHERGRDMRHDDYHLVVQVWIENSKGEWLISKRCPEKPYGGKWETTGGSVVAGENSFEAALREVREELGVMLDPSRGRLVATERCDYPRWKNPGFIDVYTFRHDCPIESIVLQPGETCDAMWASLAKLDELRESGELFQGDRVTPPFDAR